MVSISHNGFVQGLIERERSPAQNTYIGRTANLKATRPGKLEAHMILDLIWMAGEVLSIAALLAGAFLALMQTPPFLDWFNSEPAANARLPALEKKLRLTA